MSLAVVSLGALSVWAAIVTQNGAQGLSRAGVQTSGHLRAVQALSLVDTTTDELEKAIVKEASAYELRELAVQRGMKTLRQDGIHKALQGITTLEEVLARTAD